MRSGLSSIGGARSGTLALPCQRPFHGAEEMLGLHKVMLPQSKSSGLREHERPRPKENYGVTRVAAAVPFNTVGAIPVK